MEVLSQSLVVLASACDSAAIGLSALPRRADLTL